MAELMKLKSVKGTGKIGYAFRAKYEDVNLDVIIFDLNREDLNLRQIHSIFTKKEANVYLKTTPEALEMLKEKDIPILSVKDVLLNVKIKEKEEWEDDAYKQISLGPAVVRLHS